MMYRFSEHDYGISGVGFTDDCRFVVSVGIKNDGNIYVLEAATGDIVGHLK
ncbi:hypothetical protein KIPB_014698, partial [Kipferlia bialata]|eukprot:g14698.t1